MKRMTRMNWGSLLAAVCLVLGASGLVSAAEEKAKAPGKVPSEDGASVKGGGLENFPTEAAKSHLTKEQRQKGCDNYQKAINIYNGVFDFSTQGELEAARKNLAYVEKRLNTAGKDLAEKSKQLADLRALLLRKKRMIDASGLPRKMRDDQILQLYREHEWEKDFLSYRIKSLNSETERLTKRANDLKLKIKFLSTAPSGKANRVLTAKDRKDKEIEAAKAAIGSEQKAEQKERANNYKVPKAP